MKTLSILTLAAALALPTTASAAPFSLGQGLLLPEQGDYTEDPEYRKLLAEERAKIWVPYTLEYANILAESKALERYQAGEKASPFFFDMDSLYIPTGNPVRQEDYLK
ncbi:MAG: hypothetical protein HZB91_12440, partial [Elusimicrobia bacterium]|nr:hypothetical protein [Elusimicrobiota bacterium]